MRIKVLSLIVYCWWALFQTSFGQQLRLNGDCTSTCSIYYNFTKSGITPDGYAFYKWDTVSVNDQFLLSVNGTTSWTAQFLKSDSYVTVTTTPNHFYYPVELTISGSPFKFYFNFNFNEFFEFDHCLIYCH